MEAAWSAEAAAATEEKAAAWSAEEAAATEEKAAEEKTAEEKAAAAEAAAATEEKVPAAEEKQAAFLQKLNLHHRSILLIIRPLGAAFRICRPFEGAMEGRDCIYRKLFLNLFKK